MNIAIIVILIGMVIVEYAVIRYVLDKVEVLRSDLMLYMNKIENLKLDIKYLNNNIDRIDNFHEVMCDKIGEHSDCINDIYEKLEKDISESSNDSRKEFGISEYDFDEI